jgi:hypothetical protein
MADESALDPSAGASALVFRGGRAEPMAFSFASRRIPAE